MTHYTLKHASPGRCELVVATPSYAYHDRTGHVSSWGVIKMVQDASIISIYHGFVTGYLDEHVRLFAISEKCSLYPTFYSYFSWARKLQKYHVVCAVSSVTLRSICIKTTFSDKDNGRLYLVTEIKLVPVNVKTRQVEKFQQSYYESTSKLVDHELGTRMTRKQDALIPPDTSFRTTFQTRYSDQDFNLHINAAEYYRFCSDAASEASLSGYYRRFTSDIANFPVMQTESTFLCECGPAEQVIVYTWQDKNDFTKLYFVVCSKEVRIFQACFVYDSKVLQETVMSKL